MARRTGSSPAPAIGWQRMKAGMGKDRAGFTLVEILVVAALIAVLVALAIPNVMPWMAHYRVGSAARNIASDLQFSRIRAISENNDYVVCFDTTHRLYTIIDDQDGDGVDGLGCANPAGDDIIVKTMSLPKNVTFGFSPGARGTPYGCWSGGSCTALSDPATFTDDTVNFNPDGSAEGGYVYMKNEMEETYAVGVRTTGHVQVWQLRSGTSDGWKRK